MGRKRIAVLMASIDREYQQEFAAGLVSAGAKYDIDEIVTIKGKVSVVTSDETGTIYQVKVIANDKATTLFFKEDEIEEVGP